MIHSDAAETSRCATHPERASVRAGGQGASSIGLRKKRTPLSENGNTSRPAAQLLESRLESKENMRRRGVPSPDEWDAVALTFAEPVAAVSNFHRKLEYGNAGTIV